MRARSLQGLRAGIITAAVLPALTVMPAARAGGGTFMTFGPSAAVSGNPAAYPLPAAQCAASVIPVTTERIPANTAADAIRGPAAGSTALGPWAARTPAEKADLSAVRGQYTGTTDEILEWAACRWGWNEDWLRAEAVRESSWRQSEVGDQGHSFGILQVRAARAGTPAASNSGWGGYPYTHTSTAFAAEFLAAYMRACYDGADTWLYRGQSVAALAAAHGWAWVAWGCVGSWFSGAWYTTAAQGYIARVQAALAAKAWLALGTARTRR